MVRRLALLVATILTSLLAASAGAVPASPHIIAIGDLHGDFSAWQAIARSAGLVNANGHWTGGRTILVQMGDITDREPDSLKIIRSLQQLQREAPRKGGKAIVVLGNHEAMNLLGDNRYTTPGEYAAFVDAQSPGRRDRVYEANRAALEAIYKTTNPALTPDQARAQWMTEHPLGWVEHKLAWSPSGDLGRWAASNPAIVKIGDTLFVHGGISAEYAKQPLDAVNSRVARAMATADGSPASILSDPLGPLWYRGLVAIDHDAMAARAAMKPPTAPYTPEAELTDVLAAYGARRLVIAHTPSLAGIKILGNGRLACIDTGISRFYGGPLTWLEIVDGSMIPHSVSRTP
ncbi:MAG TPA: metallophosphoesterase [Sphingomicrobium sp.]|nr:metallophosphoesterase [Sphingomicrobium sp.]